MNIEINGSNFKGGTIVAPASKSQSQRALLFASMASGQSEIENILLSPDIFAMQDACKAMGAKIKQHANGRVTVVGVAGRPEVKKRNIYVGGSGQVLRFFSAAALCCRNKFTITGDQSISSRRSMSDLVNGFEQLGVKVNYLEQDGYAPLSFNGQLKAGRVQVVGNDSQVVSALLISSYYLPGVTSITATSPGETPWVYLTLDWLGRDVKTYNLSDNMLTFNVIGKREREAFNYVVPGDFSSIAYIVAAAAICGVTLQLEGLDWNDPQGDRRFIDILIELDKNNVINKTRHGLVVNGKANFISDIEIDINDCIDMITIIAVVACYAKGETRITGASIAKQKESNRLDSIAIELKKMGAKIITTPDGLIITGSDLYSANCNSWDDHRVAMALSVAALPLTGKTSISQANCVEKSYPGFWQELIKMGADIARL
jgi:3-phosphoshikimate 1-carboxyvinyltransferase